MLSGLKKHCNNQFLYTFVFGVFNIFSNAIYDILLLFSDIFLIYKT